MNPTAAEIAEALRPVIREEVQRALVGGPREERVTVSAACKILGVTDPRTVYAMLDRAGRSPLKSRQGRARGIRQADLDALLAARL